MIRERISVFSSSLDLREAEKELVKDINEMIERVKSAVIELVSQREKKGVLSIRLPLYFKAEILETARKLQLSLPDLIERILIHYRRICPSEHEEKILHKKIEDEKELREIFTPIKKGWNHFPNE